MQETFQFDRNSMVSLASCSCLSMRRKFNKGSIQGSENGERGSDKVGTVDVYVLSSCTRFPDEAHRVCFRILNY